MLVRDFKLCYVDGAWAFFTNDMAVRGDDWDDAPHHCNASDPYPREEKGQKIAKVAFDGDLETVGTGYYEGPLSGDFSVDDFNRGKVPWLAKISYGKEYPKAEIEVWAGTTLHDFRTLVQKAGGLVYEPTRYIDPSDLSSWAETYEVA